MQYEQIVLRELQEWQQKINRKPTILSKLSRRVQTKINSYIPNKVHAAVTATIKQMVRAVLFGAKFTTKEATVLPIQETEEKVQQLVTKYKHTAAVEGGLVGTGGF